MAIELAPAHGVPDVSDLPLAELYSLKGRKAVITGGARGIGYAIAHRFAEAGADLVVADLDFAKAEEAAYFVVRDFEGKAFAAPLQASDPRSVESLAQFAIDQFGAIDVWVNNAGVYPMKPALEMTEADWDKVLDINLKGMFFGAQAAAKRMIAAGKPGVIINLTSTAGYRGFPGASAYVASKHGVRGLTRALAAEFGPYQVRVLALAPTVIETPGIDELRRLMNGQGPDLVAAIAAREPLGRAGVADDVARVALFCASDMSMLMTGSTLAVDAGDLAI